MSKTQWPHTLHLSPNPEKMYVLVFKLEGPVYPVTVIFQIQDVPVPKPEVLVSTG
jgi:hypothetical protein